MTRNTNRSNRSSVLYLVFDEILSTELIVLHLKESSLTNGSV